VQRSSIFGLLGLAIGLLSSSCTEPPTGEPYEGSCPILIECADLLAPDQSSLFRYSYGVDGTCWSNGPNYWEACRDSCVDALASINLAAQALGESCGACMADSDCASFGADARCEANWCARPQLGSDDGAPSVDEETETGPDEGDSGQTVDEDIAPECLVDAPVVVIVTNYGELTVQLDRVAAKTAADSFLRHLTSDFYDNTLVHRVVDGVLVQSGVYAPGPSLRSGALAQAIGSLPALGHEDGAIALVVTGQTVAAQWYVTDGAQPQLDGTGAVFGRVIDGDEVIDLISAVEVSTLAWMGYQLLDFPIDEIVVDDMYCVE
jgi:peptidyl-prolyl cis-trans isomerase B (cyclophilin B)